MEGIPLSRASQLLQVTATLERRGFTAERMLEQAKLPMWHYCDPEDLIPTQHIQALMDHAARSLGSPTFGLEVATDNELATLGTYGRLVANAPTVHHAFQTSCRLLHLHTSAARNWLAETDEEVWFCRSSFQGPEVGRWQMEQYVVARLVEQVRLGAGPSWCPAKVCLQTRRTLEPEVREALGDPEIRSGQKFTAIAVPRALLVQPLRRRGTAPADVGATAQSRLRRSAPASSFVDTLRQLAGSLLKEEGPPRIEAMAGIAGLSVRSLQRRLAKENLSHFQIVDQARYQAATRLLEESEIRITDIAMDLGYTDSAHFTRAFRRWSGVTPRAYRIAKKPRPLPLRPKPLGRPAMPMNGSTVAVPKRAAAGMPLLVAAPRV